MTVTPHGVNGENTVRSENHASFSITTSEASVAVAETGTLLSAVPAGADRLIVTVHGDIDMRSAASLEDYVCSRVTDGVHIVFDLSGVGFFGIAGLSVFTGLDAVTASRNASWCLVEGHPVQRLLEAAAVVPSVRRFTSVSAALA